MDNTVENIIVIKKLLEMFDDNAEEVYNFLYTLKYEYGFSNNQIEKIVLNEWYHLWENWTEIIEDLLQFKEIFLSSDELHGSLKSYIALLESTKVYFSLDKKNKESGRVIHLIIENVFCE